ncbi:MAG TPA: hypothetical protein VGO11_24265 [Chthoniobacteraceae bacterium]|jgi:hypothetical protein|nr:hypothetical protein [Chthoniobacteraceae bacterium]
MRNTLACCTASLLFLAGPPAPAKSAGPPSVEAQQIALKYKTDPKAADEQYRDKTLTVSGTLQQVSAGDNVTTAAVLLLATNPGLPLVRVEMTFPKESAQTGTTYEFRVVDGQRLEYRTRHKDFAGTTMPAWVTGIRRTSRGDQWTPLLQKGETVSLVGQCKGRAVDVMMKDAALLKDGWSAGRGGGMVAAGGSSGSSSYDPNAAWKANEQANQRNQVMQQNQQANQASAQRDFQSKVQSMNQAATAPTYRPPTYTPPSYTPPAYTPPAYNPPPVYNPPPYRPPPGG